ncbi:MAG: RHS repeat-associated core domain-containing protein, partial [bacterium]|nr:RHS repeat-associated core domain-containing protein [bacterium]
AFDEYRGHRWVKIIDNETNLCTETWYEQNGVHNGLVKERKSYDAGGKLISHLKKSWMALDYNGGRYMPFVQEEVVKNYAEDGKTVLSMVVKKIPKRSDGSEETVPWKYEVDEFGNVLVQYETTYDGDEKTGVLILQLKTNTSYKNVTEGTFRLIGLPVESETRFWESTPGQWQLMERTKINYNDRGQVVDEFSYYDRNGPGKAYRETNEYHPQTGKITKKYRYDGLKKMLVEENRYYGEGCCRFLKSHLINAMGQVEETREYDLQSRGASYVVQIDGIVLQTAYDGLCRTVEEVFSGQNSTAKNASKDSVQYTYITTPGERSIETRFIYTGEKKKEFLDSLNRKFKVLETGYRGRWIVKEYTEFHHKTRKPGRISEPYFEDETSPGFRVLEYNDARLRQTKETHPGGKVLRIVYDGFKKTTLEDIHDLDDHGNPGELLHTRVVEEETKDALGRVIKRTTGPQDGSTRYTVFFSYDAAGRLIEVTDSMQVTLLTVDYGSRLDDKPVNSMDAGLGKTSMEYDGLGRVTVGLWDFKADLDRVSTVSYDDLDRKIEETFRDTIDGVTRIIRSKYDTAGNGVGKLARRHVTETNNLGRYVYEKRFTYDDFGLPASIFREWDVQWSAVDIERKLELRTDYFHNGCKGGRLERIQHPTVDGMEGGTTEYIYDDSSGQVVGIRFNGRSVWKVPNGRFTARDQVEQSVLGSGIVSFYDYNRETGRLAAIHTQKGDTPLLEYRLGYDTAGNVKRKRMESASPGDNSGKNLTTVENSYSYDDNNQLTAALENGKKQAFTYKANGSRTHFGDGGEEVLYAYDGVAPHQVSALSGARDRHFSYDKAGNMIQDLNKQSGYTRRFTWNPSNKLQQVDFMDSRQHMIRRLCFGYDGEDRRAVMYDSLQGRLTFYGDDFFEVEWEGKEERPTIRSHILNEERRAATFFHKGANQQGRLVYYHRDLLNSVILLTGENGSVLEAASYDPFGRVRTGGGNSRPDILFTGHRADVVDYEGFQQNDFKARVYEPELGVFISPDDIDDQKNTAFGFNRYVYVGNNPTSRWDPTGNEGEDDEKLKSEPDNVEIFPSVEGFKKGVKNMIEGFNDISKLDISGAGKSFMEAISGFGKNYSSMKKHSDFVPDNDTTTNLEAIFGSQKTKSKSGGIFGKIMDSPSSRPDDPMITLFSLTIRFPIFKPNRAAANKGVFGKGLEQFNSAPKRGPYYMPVRELSEREASDFKKVLNKMYTPFIRRWRAMDKPQPKIFSFRDYLRDWNYKPKLFKKKP